MNGIYRAWKKLREILTGGQSFSWIDEGDCFSATLNEKVYRVRSIDDFRADAFLYGYFDLDFDYDGARAAIASKSGGRWMHSRRCASCDRTHG